MNELRARIGKNLKAARKAAGFKSARAFAEFMNLNVGTYTEYEQGRNAMSYELAWEIADKLDISLDKLAGRPTPEATQDQAELMNLYSRCTTQRKQRLIEDARDAAYLSGDGAESDNSMAV